MNESKILEPPMPDKGLEAGRLHPAWQRFIEYCAHLKHGEIERLAIQDGLPVSAESTTKKVKFTK